MAGNTPDQIVARINAELAKMKAAMGAALYQEGLAIDALATKAVPVDFGRLRASHYVSPPMDVGGQLAVEIGFGTDYAIPVHENLEARHPHGQAKFLEQAYYARLNGFADRLARRTRANYRAGVLAAPISAPTEPDNGSDAPQHGPTRHDKVVGERGERRKRVSAKRKARKAERQAQRKVAAKTKRAAKAARKRERKQATKEAKRWRKLRRKPRR